MNVTVGICTWNRADLLDKTLCQMRQLEIPAGVSWELLIANNRSTDHTDAIIERHARLLPIRRIYEPRQGKSFALNTAMEAARGELILWTDDDVLVDPRWLAETVAAAQAHPEHSFFGGPIEPWFTRRPPQWLKDNWQFVASAFAARELGTEIHEFNRHRLPYGANLTIRTSVQRQFSYNERLGRVGANEVRGEETQVLREMVAAGERGLWIPTAKVQHYIPPERINMDYLIRFFHGMGLTDFQHEVIDGKSLPERRLPRQRRRVLRRAIRGQATALVSRLLPFSRNGWVRARLQAARNWGYYEASGQSHCKAA